MNSKILIIFALLMAPLTECSFQQGRYFVDSLSLCNTTHAPITILNGSVTTIIQPGQTAPVDLSCSFIAQNKLCTISCPRPISNQPIALIYNAVELDINTLLMTKNVYEYPKGLNQLVVENNTYYEAEFVDLNKQQSTPVIIEPQETFPKNVHFSSKNQPESIWGSALISTVGETFSIKFPRRNVYLAGFDAYNSGTVRVGTLVDCKKFGIKVDVSNAKPSLLASLVKK